MKKGNEGDTSALYVWNGICMFWGTSFHTDPHLHNTLQLVFDIDKQFRLKDADTDWTAFSAAIIKDGHLHQLDSCGSIQLFIYLDKDSDYAKRLCEKYLSSRGIADLQQSDIRKLSTDFFKKLLVQSDCKVLMEGCQTIFNRLIGSREMSSVDERIAKAVAFISGAQHRQFKVADVAEHVCLSESRLRHLFKEQVGQPIQNFIMWMKVVDSLNMILQGKQLAQSAIDAGFWDGSHMNRSYKELIGLPPGQVKAFEKQLRIVSCRESGFYTLKTELHESLSSNKAKRTIEI
ncbi:MAG: helix-turn-helix transcriptional regulator [Roseivirga sp.]|nr:helix-turn-helix transcriptional regulator [Roseivirga sp.]